MITPQHDMPPYFIVGMPRAGTTWLMKSLNLHPDVTALGESLFWGRWYVQPDADGTYGTRQLDELHQRYRRRPLLPTGTGPGCLKPGTTGGVAEMVDGVFRDLRPPTTPAEVFRRYCAAVREAEGTSVVVEKTPHHVHWLDRIARAYPDTRFVVTLRDPYGFLLSSKYQGSQLKAEIRRSFSRQYHPLVSSLIWRRYVDIIARARERHGSRLLVISLDEIKRDPAAILGTVQEFLGVERRDLGEGVRKDNSSFPSGPRPQLEPEDFAWLHLVTGDRIRETGFERRETPLAPLRFARSVGGIPRSAFHYARALRSNVASSWTRYAWSWVRPRR